MNSWPPQTTCAMASTFVEESDPQRDSDCPERLHLVSALFRLNNKWIKLLLLIGLLNWYYQKPFIGLIGAGQMYDVRAVPSTASETQQIFRMRSYHHNVGSHVKLPAGRARNPLTHIHVGNSKSIDVLRPPGKTILHPLK